MVQEGHQITLLVTPARRIPAVARKRRLTLVPMVVGILKPTIVQMRVRGVEQLVVTCLSPKLEIVLRNITPTESSLQVDFGGRSGCGIRSCTFVSLWTEETAIETAVTLAPVGILASFLSKVRNSASAVGQGLHRSVGAMVNTTVTPAGRPVTVHGAERLLERFGSLQAADDIIANASSVVMQRNGAIVHVRKTGRGRKAEFDLVVEGDEGIVTGIKNLSRTDVKALSKTYDWESVPY